MEFKKIDINQTTFKEISEALWHAYTNGEEATALEDMNTALKNVVFNVKKPYIEGEWNDCDAIPPSDYDLEDVLVRRKYMNTWGERKHTSNIQNYILAYFRAEDNKFVDEDGFDVLKDVAVSNYEYKFIK